MKLRLDPITLALAASLIWLFGIAVNEMAHNISISF